MPRGKRNENPVPPAAKKEKPIAVTTLAAAAVGAKPAPGAGDNIGTDRSKLLVHIIDQLNIHNKKIANLNTQLSAAKADRSAFKNKEIKGTLGMKIEDFELSIRAFELEYEERKGLFGTLREVFNALGIGEQMNFLPTLDDTGAVVSNEPQAAPAAAEKSVTTVEAYDHGVSAGKKGEPQAVCPFTPERHPMQRDHWLNGWTRGQSDLAHEMAPKSEDAVH